MNKTDYPKALQAAQIELERLVQERIELDKRIVRLKQTITGLTGLCDGNNDSPASSTSNAASPGARGLKLTSGIRQALADAVSPMRPPELRETLSELGLNMTQYSNKLAVIHNTLSRLERQGEVSELGGAWVLTEKGRLASRMDYIDFTSMQPAEAVPAMVNRILSVRRMFPETLEMCSAKGTDDKANKICLGHEGLHRLFET